MRGRRTPAVLVSLLACGACQHPIVPPESGVDGLAGAAKVYTLANLHPDDRSETVSAANLQNLGLIPLCSEVVLLQAYAGSLQFEVAATGKRYWFLDHRASGEPFAKHLARYFGRACPQAELDALTPAEKDAVRRGVVQKGMRKQAVLLAIGYPPARDTPTLEMPRWRYWSASNRYFTVTFDGDGVVEDVFY
jgi:hypothetical protein